MFIWLFKNKKVIKCSAISPYSTFIPSKEHSGRSPNSQQVQLFAVFQYKKQQPESIYNKSQINKAKVHHAALGLNDYWDVDATTWHEDAFPYLLHEPNGMWYIK